MINTKDYILDLSMPEKVALFNELYSELAGYGTDGDTELAHVNTFEARLLKSIGGSGTINEITELRQFGGGGQPAPPAQQSVTQTTEFPPELRPFISDILGEAQAEFQREKQEGFLPFPGPQIASFTPEQQAAFETGRQQFTGFAGTPLAAGETYARPALASTALGTSEVGAEDIGRRMDPFLQNVVDIAKREAIRDEEAAVQGRAAQAVGAGSFGGTRQALVESEAERNLAERLGDIQARGLSTAFQNAQQSAEAQRQRELAGGRQFAAIGDIAGQRARADIGGLAGIGETQQQRRQQALDIARQEFGQEQVFPAQTLGKYQSIVRGFPYQMGFTQQAQQTIPTPSLAQTLTGGAATAAGLYGMFGGFKPSKEGGMIGRQGGGLVSLEGGGVPTAPTTGGVPQVPLGAQKMVPHLMKMYESNPQFKNKIDQDIQAMIPQVQGTNLGAGGAQTNLGMAGAPPFTGKGGGLVSLNVGTGEDTITTQQERLASRFDALEEEAKKRLPYEEVQKESREYWEEQNEKARRRKEQALWMSLIAGGAGVLEADPQKGLAAAWGSGIGKAAPLAYSAMGDFADAEADIAQAQRTEALAGRDYEYDQKRKDLEIELSRTTSVQQAAQIKHQMKQLELEHARYNFASSYDQLDDFPTAIWNEKLNLEWHGNKTNAKREMDTAAAIQTAVEIYDKDLRARDAEGLPMPGPHVIEQNVLEIARGILEKKYPKGTRVAGGGENADDILSGGGFLEWLLPNLTQAQEDREAS